MRSPRETPWARVMRRGDSTAGPWALPSLTSTSFLPVSSITASNSKPELSKRVKGAPALRRSTVSKCFAAWGSRETCFRPFRGFEWWMRGVRMLIGRRQVYAFRRYLHHEIYLFRRDDVGRHEISHWPHGPEQHAALQAVLVHCEAAPLLPGVGLAALLVLDEL